MIMQLTLPLTHKVCRKLWAAGFESATASPNNVGSRRVLAISCCHAGLPHCCLRMRWVACMHSYNHLGDRWIAACCRCCLRLLTKAEKEAHKPHPDCSSVDTCAARLCQALAWSAPPITSFCHMSACSVPLRTSTTRLYEFTRPPATLRLYSLLNTRCAFEVRTIERGR